MKLKSTDIIEFRIPNWDKYQKKYTKQYFRIETDIFDDPKLLRLGAVGKLFYIYLLTQQARGSSDLGTFFVSRVTQTLPCKRSALELHLDKLLELGLIELPKIPKERKKERVEEKQLQRSEPTSCEKQEISFNSDYQDFKKYIDENKIGGPQIRSNLEKIYLSFATFENFKSWLMQLATASKVKELSEAKNDAALRRYLGSAILKEVGII